MISSDWIAVAMIPLGVYFIVGSRFGTRDLIVRQNRYGWVKLKDRPTTERTLIVMHVICGVLLILGGLWMMLIRGE